MQNDSSSQPWARYTWSLLQAQEILEAALQLPQEQREVLVDRLAASLELGDPGEYWEGEIQRRIQDVDAGRVATIPADEVFARLEQRFGGK
jgi:putative addiction module component (TIGR02574 family)